MLAGDGGRLKANTGDVSRGGVLGIDADRSNLTSGTSTPPDARSPESTSADRDAIPQDIAARGYELSPKDSSFSPGESSVGLNVVDVKRSNVRSGDHIENGEEDENGEDENGENGEEEAGVAEETSTPTSSPAPSGADDGNDTGSAGGSGGTASVADEGDASATGDDALAIGGDGYDDLAVDVAGKRNVATYDDSNVVKGGTGGANTQVGDSDTSGAVIMEATDSTIESGNST